MRRGAGEVADLRRQHESVTADPRDEAAEKTFGASVAIHVRGVEQIRPELDGELEPGNGGGLVNVRPAHRHAEVAIRAADGPAAHTDRGHLDAAPAQQPPRQPPAYPR
jgi:hypothetical protein